MNKKVLFITRTAVMLALLISLQAVTSPLGATPLTKNLITGSLVNLVLIVTIVICGIYSGLFVAGLSPVFAALFGIAPMWPLVPFIAFGNITIVLVWHLFCKIKFNTVHLKHIFATIIGAASKFIILYLTIVEFAVPYLLSLPAPQADVISYTFSFPQFLSASIGGAVATIILPILLKTVKNNAQTPKENKGTAAS